MDPDAPGGIGGDHKWRHFLHWLVSHSPGVPSLNALPAMHTGDELQVVNIPGPAVKKGEALAPYKGKQMQPVLRAIDSTQDQTTEMSTGGCRTRASERQASLCHPAMEAAWGGEGTSS